MKTSYAPNLMMKPCHATAKLCTRIGAKPCNVLRALFFILALLFTVHAQLHADEAPMPTVSTDGNEVWYYISVTAHGKYLTDNSTSGSEMVVGISAYTGLFAQQWKVMGNETDGYTFYSRTGHQLYAQSTTDSDAFYTGTTSSTSYTTFNLISHAISSSDVEQRLIEIRETDGSGTGKYLNYQKGTDARVWNNISGPNSGLTFTEVTESTEEDTSFEVSTDDNEVWYFLYLANRGKYITDNSSDGTATNATLNVNMGLDGQMWKITGNSTDGYTLTSKLGNKFYFNSTSSRAEATGYTAATPDASYVSTVALTSTEISSVDYFLISPSTATSVYINQYGGTNSSVIGNYDDATDVGSHFLLIPAANMDIQLPTSSTDDEDYWYTLSLTNGGLYVQGETNEGTKAHVRIYSKDRPEQLWKFVGDNINGYTLTTNAGMSLFVDSLTSVYNGKGYFYTRANVTNRISKMKFVFVYDTSISGFRRLLTPINSEDTSTETGLYLNQEGGSANGNNCCLYDKTNDANSYLKLTACTYDTPTPPTASTEGNEVWYTLQVRDGKYVTDMGDDVRVQALERNASNIGQLWKTTVDADGRYTFISRNGRTLYVKSAVATPTDGTTSEAYVYAATSPTQTYSNFAMRCRLNKGVNYPQFYLILSSSSNTRGRGRRLLSTIDGQTRLYLNLLTTDNTEVLGLTEEETDTTTLVTLTERSAVASLTVDDNTVTHYVNQVFDHITASTTKVTLDLTPYYNQILSDLGKTADELETNGLYLRWHLEDADGEMLTISASELTAAATTTELVTADDNALYWYSKTATTANLSTAQTDVLKVVYTPTDTLKLARVVCDLVTNVSGITTADGAVTDVAATTPVASRYIFRMIETKADAAQYFIPTTATATTEETVEWAYANIDKSEPLLTIDGYTRVNCYDKIKTISSATTGLYVRWYLTDAEGNVLADQSAITSGVDADNDTDKNHQGAFFTTTSSGLCFYPRGNAATLSSTTAQNRYPNPKVTLPTGMTWDDIRLVCIVATDLTDWKTTSVIGDCFAYFNNFGIAADPLNIAAKFTYTFTAVAPTPRRFHHTSGYAYRYDDSKLGSNGQQLVHSWSYTCYVKRGESKSLVVPVDDYENDGNDQEPASYWRWFNYNTDHASAHITTDADNGYSLNRSTNGTLYDQFTVSADDNTSWGLFKWDLRKGDYNSSTDGRGCFPNRKNVAGVIFNAPSEDTWVGDTIACDVSRYRDFKNVEATDTDPGSFTEPTLSLRYYFYVYPAKTCAEDIMNALIANSQKPFEDNGNIVVGIPSATSGSTITLRLNQKSATSYYLYPRTSNAYNKTYTTESFDTSNLLQGSTFTWRVYTTDGNDAYYCDLSGYINQDKATAAIKLSALQGNYTLVGGTTTKRIPATAGREYTILVYLNSAESYTGTGKVSSNDIYQNTILARFNLVFSADSGILTADEAKNHAHRSNDYLDENYVLKGEITFDDFDGMTYDAPSVRYDTDDATVNNSWNTPIMWDEEIQWDFANYSFVYPGLWNYNGTNYYETSAECASSWNTLMGISPYHGDYTIIKSMNASIGGTDVSTTNSVNMKSGGISSVADGTDAIYCWWIGKTVYDRTHDRDASKYGHFLYVDASDESRPIATMEFNANLCTGSAIVASIAVADLTTDGKEPPQLVFKLYAYRTEGTKIVEKKLVQSFAAPNFHSTLGKNPTYGEWYQVYARTYITSDVNVEDYTKYMITIDNYAASTNGADYAIDDIRIYTRNNRVEVLQQDTTGIDCSKRDKEVHLKLRTDNATMRTLLGLDTESSTVTGKPFYYRIYRASDNALIGADGNAATNGKVMAYDKTTSTYKWVDADDFYYTVWYSNSLNSSSSSSSTSSTTETTRTAPYIEQDATGNAYYVFADSTFLLPSGVAYYVSACEPVAIYNGTEIAGYEPDGEWGDATKSCTNYSNTFINEQPTLIITNENGSVTSTFEAACGEEEADLTIAAKLKIANAVWGGSLTIGDYPFDWFVRKGNAISGDERTKLVAAVAALRTSYPDAAYYTKDYKGNVTVTALPTTYDDTYTREVHDLLQTYIGKDELYLTCSDTLRAHITFSDAASDQTLSLMLIPKAGTYTDETDTATVYTYTICASPMDAGVTVKHSGPKLLLGMTGVDYPDDWGSSAKYLRLGIEQLKALLGGKEFRLPIYDYRDASGKTAATGGRNVLTMYRDSHNDNRLQIIESSDPTFTARFTDTPTVILGTVTSYVENSSTSLLIDLSATNISSTQKESTVTNTLGITADNVDKYFHEGYEYTFQMRYIDAGVNADEVLCDGYTDIVVQIVPAYVTWTNRSSSGTNWNRDGNWRRSRAPELFKTSSQYTDYATTQYTSTTAATVTIDTPDEDDATYTKPTAFVPMKFTRVTIPAGVTSPNLNTYERNDALGIITNLVNMTNAPATTNINLALMLKTEVSSDGIYDIEAFYANTCKEIYFKPEAKLRNQHYLDYESAWVDFETPLNDWTIWASPLRNIYAGDMYVPVTSAASTNGRQLTEAFQPISFVKGTNSRNGYPVFQRSWDKTNAMVITAASDPRADYDAYVTYPTAEEREATDDTIAIMSQWSHNYNDVSELYYPGQGIALYAGKPNVTYTTPARFRLPKADTSYDYYTYQDNAGTVSDADKKTLTKDAQGRGILAISETGVAQSRRNGQIKMPVQQTNHSGGYYLVGNPYMASLNMREFFLDAYNPAFCKKYWVLEDGQLVGYGAGETGTGKSGNKSTLGSVEPMKAFFIKLRDGATAPDSVWFAPAMTGATTYGTSTSDIESSTARLRLTATAGNYKSTASVIASRKADNDFNDDEDVEMLFDSNLSDRPVVYSVAGQMTTQINRMADLTNVPLGFRYSGTEPLKFFVTGVSRLSKPVYLRDAKTGTCTALADSMTVEVEPNAVGRYFLTSEATPQRAIQTALRCYSLEAGKVVAATSEGDRLTDIAIYDTAARLQRAWTPNVTSCTFDLYPGIYLITLTSEAVPEGRTFKVLVK